MPWPKKGVPTYNAVRTFILRSFNQSVGCLQWLRSRAYGPAKQSIPRLFSTIP